MAGSRGRKAKSLVSSGAKFKVLSELVYFICVYVMELRFWRPTHRICNPATPPALKTAALSALEACLCLGKTIPINSAKNENQNSAKIENESQKKKKTKYKRKNKNKMPAGHFVTLL